MDERARPQEKHRLGACGRTVGCERQYGVVGVTPNVRLSGGQNITRFGKELNCPLQPTG